MKADLDQLILENDVEAILVTGSALHNPAMHYFTGGVHISHAELLKKHGQNAVIYCSMMEREEAAKTGLESRIIQHSALVRKANGDRFKINVLRIKQILKENGISRGKVIVYGKSDVGMNYSILSAVKEYFPEIEFSGDCAEKLLLAAMETKDENEIAHIHKMGKITAEVVGLTAAYMQQCRVKNEILLGEDGQAVTVGEMKNKINLWLAERGAENPEDTIFAIGRDSGIPHSSGTPTDLIRLGQPIVFDIYPCEAGGGYFYDFTRTWCLGYAPDKVQKLYDQVKSVYDKLVETYKINTVCYEYQKLTCDLFEQMGHPTVTSHPDTSIGYNHSISHGLGLSIHEKPWFGSKESREVIKPGSVFTIEPGLYYPDEEMGVRIEDTYWAKPDGSIARLVEYPYDLILPMSR
jgi:Xaa-Pro aminopeptidase